MAGTLNITVGLILIFVIMYAPMGFLGIVQILKEKWFGKMSKQAGVEEAA